jgi:hypothetical protein
VVEKIVEPIYESEPTAAPEANPKPKRTRTKKS